LLACAHKPVHSNDGNDRFVFTLQFICRIALARESPACIIPLVMGWSFSSTTQFEFGGKITLVSADGNNVAWRCPCGAPVLFVYQAGRRGSAALNPSKCARCDALYFLEPQYGTLSEPPRGTSLAPAEKMQIVRKDTAHESGAIVAESLPQAKPL
jgi:hypothetical protein